VAQLVFAQAILMSVNSLMVTLPVLGLALYAQFRSWSSKRSQLSPNHP
jgi:hypothetical protein